MPADLNPQLKDLLEKMLEKEPDKRITLKGVRNHPWLTEPIVPEGSDKISREAVVEGTVSEYVMQLEAKATLPPSELYTTYTDMCTPSARGHDNN